MYRESEQIVTANGAAETKQGAFQQALTRMKATISKSTGDLLLQIEPRDVEVVAARQTSYREKFLGVLFPRTRTRYEVTIRVTVKLRSVDLDQVHFIEKAEPSSVFQRILKMR
jgi:uncharacterized protein (TIGR03578 family)